MLTREEALAMFKEDQALLEGHFRLTSGRHSDRYMQCALVLQHPDHTARLGEELARRFRGQRIDLVIGPAMGGIIVAYEVARALGVRALFTERENGVMSLRRGFTIKPGEKVLVVEDVVTTGGSVQEVIEVVKGQGGEVVGVGVLVDRSNGQVKFGVQQEAVLTLDVVSWPAEECPLCKEGLPVVKPGSRQV
ncbi:MAG: orotate phosphoribosyltransferase [Firmicutes bacterium]|nr:orotate phosphoribosyltransferase [Bacillota bacterium]